MDIGMTRADYEKFAKYAPEKLGHDHYFLQTAYSDDSYGFSYMKLLDRFTYIEEKGNVNNARKAFLLISFHSIGFRMNLLKGVVNLLDLSC